MSTAELKLDPPPELKTLGLSSVVIKGRDLIIGYNQKKMICPLYQDNWTKTKKSIEKTLKIEGADPKASQV